jgi:hypothetical protein
MPRGLKLWQVGDSFDPEILLAKMTDEKQFDYDDLSNLTRQGQAPKPAETIGPCVAGYVLPVFEAMGEDKVRRAIVPLSVGQIAPWRSALRRPVGPFASQEVRV